MPSLPSRSVCSSLRIAAAVAATLLALGVRADCIDEAARRHQVNAQVLRAIGWQESRLQPDAVGRNANGSVDLGAFQINSIHWATLARYGIGRAALADGCVSADVAAWHYRRQVDALGNTWAAVGAYHSGTPARAAWYANQVAAILTRWQVMPAGVLPYAGQATQAPHATAPPRQAAGGARPAGDPVDVVAATATASPTGAAADLRTFSTLAFLPPAR